MDNPKSDVVHYERSPKVGERYATTSCLIRRLANVEPEYRTTSDTNKVTCPKCKDGFRYIQDRRSFIFDR